MEDGLDLAVSGVEHPPSPLPVEADSSGAPHCDQVESGEMVDSLLPKVVGSAGPLCEQGDDGGHAVDASPQDSGVSFRSLEVDDSVVPRCEDGAVAGDSLLAEVEESRAALCQLVQCEPDQDSLLQSSLVALHDVDPMTTVLEDEAVDATNAGSIAEDKEKSAGLGPDATVKSALEEEATSMDVETAEANDARSAAGVDEEKIAKLEPDAAVTSNLSGSEDSAKKVGMKMDADESEANDASSAWEEDVKTADSELDAAVKAASSGSEDSAEKEGMEMNTEEAEKEGMKMDTEEAEANDASSAGEEDEKTADLEPDAVVAAASSGREDSTEKEGIMMDTEEAGANEASFTGKEDEKTSDLDPDAPVVSASSDSQYAAEDAMKMDTEEAEANDASSTGEEDEKTADLEPDATTTSVVSGGDDAVEEETMEMDIEAAETMQGPGRRGGRRKKGRPPRAQAAARPPTRRKEEEEVCFICFDGGDLVVCDRRGCPKVYHPSCVNRDEAFFRAKGRWNCGMLYLSCSTIRLYNCNFVLCVLG